MSDKGKGVATSSAPKRRRGSRARADSLPVMEQGSSPDSETRRQEDELISRLDPPIHTRSKRSSEAVRKASVEKWKKSCIARTAKNERHIDPTSLDGTNIVVQAISRHGLTHFLHPNEGYNLDLVRTFYKNIDVPPKGEELEDGVMIRSSIARDKIFITPDTIAAAMGYVRPAPHRINHHQLDHFTTRQVFDMLYERPDEAHLPHVPGRFKEEFKLLNQFWAYNIFPRHKENKPDEENCIWMVAFMHHRYVYDWAVHYYMGIIEFRGANQAARLPYPCLITRICRSQMNNPIAYSKNDKLEPGNLNRSVLAWSAAQAGDAPPPLQDPPKKTSRTKELLRLIFCQNTAIMESRMKEKKERRAFERRVDHRLEYLQRRVEGSSEPFVPLEGPEPEVSDDFGGGLGGVHGGDDEDESEYESD